MQPERMTMNSPSRFTSLTLTGKVQPRAEQIINAQSRGRSFLCPAFPLTESASQYVVVEADGNYTHSQNSDIRFSQGDRIGQWDCHQGVLLLSTNASQSCVLLHPPFPHPRLHDQIAGGVVAKRRLHVSPRAPPPWHARVNDAAAEMR